METTTTSNPGPSLGWRDLAIWYATAIVIGLFPILNTVFGFFALVFTFAALIVLGALLLRRRVVSMAASHLIIGLLIAGTSWWFVTALLIDFS